MFEIVKLIKAFVMNELIDKLTAGATEPRFFLRGFQGGFAMDAFLRHTEELCCFCSEVKKMSAFKKNEEIENESIRLCQNTPVSYEKQ